MSNFQRLLKRRKKVLDYIKKYAQDNPSDDYHGIANAVYAEFGKSAVSYSYDIHVLICFVLSQNSKFYVGC